MTDSIGRQCIKRHKKKHHLTHFQSQHKKWHFTFNVMETLNLHSSGTYAAIQDLSTLTVNRPIVSCYTLTSHLCETWNWASAENPRQATERFLSGAVHLLASALMGDYRLSRFVIWFRWRIPSSSKVRRLLWPHIMKLWRVSLRPQNEHLGVQLIKEAINSQTLNERWSTSNVLKRQPLESHQRTKSHIVGLREKYTLTMLYFTM